MSKHIRQMLTASLAGLMIAGIGATSMNNNVQAKRRHTRTHRVYRHKRAAWHKGVPNAIRSNWYWLSKQSFKNGTRQMPRYKNVIWFQSPQVEMATYNYYRYGLPAYARKNKRQRRGWLMSNGLGGWWNPKYKYVGHSTYKINCGDEYHYTVKVHNHSHVSVWLGHQYMGYFHKWSHIGR